MYLLYCPCPNTECAKVLARSLIESKLAFCCNIIPQVESVFLWNGQIQESSEVILLVKVLTTTPTPTVEHLESHHPYDAPIIVCWSATSNLGRFA